MKKLRWGLLSTARINRQLVPAIRASSRAELVAVASRVRARAVSHAAALEIPHAFGSYEAMLSCDFVDVVYISLPNHLHAEWTIKALQHGKHVLCEKPLALCVEDVDRMAAASRESQRVLAEALMYRHHPQMKVVGDWVKSGRLGEITMVHSVLCFNLGARADIRLVAEYGGGCLWDVGIYPVSFAQFVAGGAPASVSGYRRLGVTGVDEAFAGLLTYSTGLSAQIASSFRTPFYSVAEILGTEGQLTLTRPFVELEHGRSVTFHAEGGSPVEIDVPVGPLYLGEVEDMHAAILDGTLNHVSLQESRDHIRTIEALYASAKAQQMVWLD